MKKPLPLRVQIYRREEQRPQDPGAKRLRLRPGGGPEGLRSRAPQIREICADPENSVAFKETANERIFRMKDLAAVKEAVGLGAKIHEEAVSL